MMESCLGAGQLWLALLGWFGSVPKKRSVIAINHSNDAKVSDEVD